MKSFEQHVHEAKTALVSDCAWRQYIIEAHQLALEQAMISDLAAYSGTETFGRIAWDLHIALDIELTKAGELLLPVSRAVYGRAAGE